MNNNNELIVYCVVILFGIVVYIYEKFWSVKN
jgi:hypothetical protein